LLVADKHFGENVLEISFILVSKFPTSKAYGVTTEYSARAVKHLGYVTRIITHKLGSDPKSNIDVIAVGSKISKVILSDRIKRLQSIRFNFFCFIYTILVRKKFKNKVQVFWTRDILLSILLSLKSKHIIVCEIHNLPTIFEYYLLKFLVKKENIVIAPISNFLDKVIPLDVKNSVLAPMAINSEEIFPPSKNATKLNQIIYLGNHESLGRSIDCNLLNYSAKEIYNYRPDWQFRFIGISRGVFAKHIDSSISTNIVFIERLDRGLIFQEISKGKIGLVSYPDDGFHQFPIKIVEYAAAGLAIIASNTKAHQNLLNSNNSVFFDYGSVDSLVKSILFLIDNPEYMNKVTSNGMKWASSLTYDNRVRNVLTCVESILSK
jgi:glycosyltransferase involved in cell wall biosynthesis